LGREQKKNRNEGGGEGRKHLPANPTILKNCVRPRTQPLIGAELVVLIKVAINTSMKPLVTGLFPYWDLYEVLVRTFKILLLTDEL